MDRDSALHVITIETPSLGDRSYVVHDGSHALVIDPQRDVDRVIEAIEGVGLTVAYVAETHLHNDYVSGGLTLSLLTGAQYLHARGEDVVFDHTPVTDGDTFDVGRLRVEVVHTPGHTPHHLTYVVRADGCAPVVFTGGSMLHGTVGRTDLISASATDGLTRAQYRSVHRLADSLPDDALIYPTHGFGSFCASVSSDEESDGTLGTEREVNLALTAADEDAFVERLVDALDSYPRYYAHIGPINRAGGVAIDLSEPAPVDPVELARRVHRGEWVVDLRPRQAFAAQHVIGTIGIELADGFATYLAWLLPWGMPVTLLADDADQITEAQRQLVRVGIDRPAGAVHGDPAGWAPDLDRSSYRVADFGAVAESGDEIAVLDVRLRGERSDGFVAGSLNVPLDELLGRLDELPDRPLWVHCGSGYRASIAASLLDRAGREVILIDDSFDRAADAGVEIRSGE